MTRNMIWLASLTAVMLCQGVSFGQFSEAQLARWLKQFPEADANGDGRLTTEEAQAYRQSLRKSNSKTGKRRGGAPRQFAVDPGWHAERFPDHAICYRTPEEIAAAYAQVLAGKGKAVTSYPRPADGSLRIVATGHSFMAPGFKSFPLIVRAAGLHQPPMLTHTGGGVTGSTRYKWEQENGIFQFDGKPEPKLLASIANAQWDAMLWGPYFQDRPAYYLCWMDFCLKYNPEMKFYLSDAWPQLGQLDRLPRSEQELSSELMERLGREQHAGYAQLVETLNQKHPGKVFILPTCDAMVLAVKSYHRGELPGVEGIHSVIGQKERSLWRDVLGHLGPGFGNLEGYVFYATLYGKSPELISGDVPFGGQSDYPSQELDRVFRRIAWQAVVNNPLSGVTDADGDGVRDAKANVQK